MKIIIVGASGKIGSRVAERLSGNHEVIRVGSRSGDIVCDYTSEPSVAALFEQAGAVDALIVAVGGDSKFKPYPVLTDEDYRFGCERKLVAQVGKGLVSADQVAEYYVEAVEGSARGEVFRAWGGLPIPE